MDRMSLLMKLSALEFSALDMQLYLNTHPADKKAIAMYNGYVKDAAAARAEYERAFGPLFSFVSPSNPDFFGWIDEPWPYQNDFNR